ncbi:MAG: TolC family protein [Syntrophobacteraceae bacterium]
MQRNFSFFVRALTLAALIFMTLGTWRVNAWSQTVTLQQLEEKIQAAPQVLSAVAELEQSLHRLAARKAASGLKMQAGLSTGTFEEPLDAYTLSNFNEATATIGLSYPLLGTRQKEQINILDARAKTWTNREKMELARRVALNTLRSYYALYWAGRRKIELSKAFLAGKNVLEQILKQRTSRGLLLDADREEFLTAFHLAARNIANARVDQIKALGIINLLTHSNFSDLSCTYPSLAQPCTIPSRLRTQILNDHPEVLLRRSLVQEQRRLLGLKTYDDVDANVQLAGTATTVYPSGITGYGVAISFSMQLPARELTAADCRQQASQASLEKSRYDLDQAVGQLQTDALAALAKYRAAREDLQYQSQRLKASLESLRENKLRKGYMAGDTIEKLQKSRFEYYKAGIDLISAKTSLFQAQADLLQLAPQGCGGDQPEISDTASEVEVSNAPLRTDLPSAMNPPPGLAPTDKVVKAPERKNAVYVWDSAPLLNGGGSEKSAWESFNAFAIDRVLLSLDRQQIQAAATAQGARRLRLSLETAHRDGLRVDLLLGEPLWILPDHRQDLLDIVKQLKGFAFDGLHLDLEPDSLDTRQYSRKYLLAQLVKTLEAVHDLSPWPLSLSIHPRYFDQKEFKDYLGEAFSKIPISEVTLMVYIANPEKVARRVAPILEANPKLRFSIALSVEPELSPGESYNSKGWSALKEAIEALKSRLDHSNFSAVIIQSWSYLKQLKR